MHLKIRKESGTTTLATVLDDEVKSKLVLMRSKLENLHKVNKEYARHVVAVKEFFDSLNEKIFGTKASEYGQDGNSIDNNFYKSRV